MLRDLIGLAGAERVVRAGMGGTGGRSAEVSAEERRSIKTDLPLFS